MDAADGMRLCHSILGRCGWQTESAHVPDDSQPTENFQDVESEVYFPPFHALPAHMHEFVVIVVPAFAQGDQREHEIIAALVRSLKPARAPQMR